jgi:hypothetical protein
MSTFTDPVTGRALRLGASNPGDEWLGPEQAARIATEVLAETHRPEGVSKPTGPGTPAARWRGLDRGHLNGGS